jgi:predicted transcriptional regulator YheO
MLIISTTMKGEYNVTTEEAVTRLKITQEYLQQERQKNAELVMQIGELKQRLEKLQAELNEPKPTNSRNAGRPKFNAQMVERLEEFKDLQTAGKNPADIMGLMNISRATYYNYLKACKALEEF